MKKALIICIILLSCKKTGNQKIILNDGFKIIVDGYLESNPYRGMFKIIKENEENNITSPYSSYNIYFDKKGIDTIMYIKLFPALMEFNPITEKIYKDGSGGAIDKIKADGFFLVDKKPIIIFDSLNYSNEIINKKKLIKQIPDSLKFQKNNLNRHIKSETGIYKISKGKFKQMTWEELHK